MVARRHADPAAARQDEPPGALQALGDTQVPIDIGGPGTSHDGTFNDFVEHQTLHGLQEMLLESGHPVRLRGAMLALGSLLRPVMQSGSSHIERGLTLPLPVDPFYRSLVAAFWLELIAPFVAQADFGSRSSSARSPSANGSSSASTARRRRRC